MDTYNATIINCVTEYVQYVLNRLSHRDQKGRILKLEKYEVLDDGDFQLSELVRLEESLLHRIKLYVRCTEQSGDSRIIESQIEVPRMINNVFIIGGKQRISTNMLVNDGRVRIYPKNIVINEYTKVVWSFPKGVTPVYEPEFFTVKTCDFDGNSLEFEGTPENYERFKQYLIFDTYTKQKLQVKLARTDIPDYLTYDLVHDLFDYGPDTRKDLVIDKTITTVEGDLRGYLLRKESRKAAIVGSYGFFKTDQLVFKGLQSLILGYFRKAQTKCIEIPYNINPLIYDALKYKVTLPLSTAYNYTFTDIIDCANTPENGNVNVINELNICVDIQNGTILYTCYDFKTHKKVQIPYMEYLTKKVLKCDYFDYDKMQIITSAKYVYRQFCIDHSINSVNEVELDLIEPSPDDRLSYTTRRLPLINMSDSVRVAMGDAMIKQAIQTEGCEPRLIASGNDDGDYENSHSVVRYQGLHEGTVTAVTNEYIDIEDKESGLTVKVEVPIPTIGAHNNIMTYESVVKVGDDVIPNQIVVTPSILKNKSYDLGVNARTVYMSYLGYSYEDGVIISESYAKKCTQYREEMIYYKIRSKDDVTGIIQIGSQVSSTEKLIENTTPPRNSPSIGHILTSGKGNTIMKALDISTQDSSLLTPNNVELGYVTDVRIYKNPKGKLSAVTNDTLNRYLTEGVVHDDYEELPEKYKNLRITDNEDINFKDGVSAIVKIMLITVNPMRIGDKSSNSWGGKGEIALILPDELMPRLDLDGKGNGPAFEIIMNPAAVVARKNPSQLYECLLTKIIIAIQKRSQELVEAGDIEGFKSFASQFYPDNRFDNIDDPTAFVDDIFNFKMNVGSFSKIKYETILEWMKILNVKEDDYIYCPDVVIYQSPYQPKTQYNDGTKACSPEYAKEHGIKGKLYELGFVERPVVTGMSYMYKLHHSGMDTGKVTSETLNYGSPLMGRGARRGEGQKIGEMELWAFKSHKQEKFITDNNPEIMRDEHLFLNELMLTGLVMTDQFGLPFDLPSRKKIAKNIKDKYKLGKQ